MNCPTCTAKNPEGAAFCGQCYAKFLSTPEPTPPVTASYGTQQSAEDDPSLFAQMFDAPAGTVEDVPVSAVASSGKPALPDGKEVGRFTSVDGEMKWTCGTCESLNSIADFYCTVCGAKIDDNRPKLTPAELEQAKKHEMLIPGWGHRDVGNGLAGTGRLVMFLLWLISMIGLATTGVTGVLSGLPLLIGIAIIWGTGPSDVQALADGVKPILDAKRFMYLVVGVTALLILIGGIAFMNGQGGA